MILTVASRSACICGYRFTSAHCVDVVINKRPIRQRSDFAPGLSEFVPGKGSGSTCPECGFRPPAIPDTLPLSAGSYVSTPWALTSQSLRDIEENRARRWPELTDEGATA